jgi:crotonobetainyl-CoA:carnitine CoA-transferase CaiB-like acyl-CoA transferase
MIIEDERGWEHIGIPMKFRHEPGKVVFDLPELGQHTEANLLAIGYTDTDIAAMREKGVF